MSALSLPFTGYENQAGLRNNLVRARLHCGRVIIIRADDYLSGKPTLAIFDGHGFPVMDPHCHLLQCTTARAEIAELIERVFEQTAQGMQITLPGTGPTDRDRKRFAQPSLF